MGLLLDMQNCGTAGNVFPATDSKANIYARAVMHVGDGGETFPAFWAHAQPTVLRTWQEARGMRCQQNMVLHTAVRLLKLYIN